jgi:hypothetical protein
MSGVRIFRLIVVAIYMVALVWVTGMAVGMAAQRGYLIAVAVPLPLIPILGLSILRRTEQRAGWVLFTIWLGSTYAATGVPSELAVFGVISLLGIAAFWSSPLAFPACMVRPYRLGFHAEAVAGNADRPAHSLHDI